MNERVEKIFKQWEAELRDLPAPAPAGREADVLSAERIQYLRQRVEWRGGLTWQQARDLIGSHEALRAERDSLRTALTEADAAPAYSVSVPSEPTRDVYDFMRRFTEIEQRVAAVVALNATDEARDGGDVADLAFDAHALSDVQWLMAHFREACSDVQWLMAHIREACSEVNRLRSALSASDAALAGVREQNERLRAETEIECPQCHGECLADGRALCGMCGATGRISHIEELAKGLEWALDVIDMSDQRLVDLGDPPGRVYSPIHRAGKQKARAAIAAARASRPASPTPQENEHV